MKRLVEGLIVLTLAMLCLGSSIAEESPSVPAVYDIITFGNYEQDGNLENGKEPIEWIVLSVEDDRALLLSKYGLDTKPFNSSLSYATWETCTLRQWLNADFYQEAFSEDEKTKILITTVSNGPEQCHKDHPIFSIPDTLDKIYLLSYTELKQYIPNEEERCTTATSYALSNGAHIMEKDNPSEYIEWLIRTVSDSKEPACVSNHEGSFYYGLYDLNYLGYCIRPSCWISLKSEQPQSEEEPLEALFSGQNENEKKEATVKPTTSLKGSSFTLNSGLTFDLTRTQIEIKLRAAGISSYFDEYSSEGGFDCISYETTVSNRDNVDVLVSLDESGRSHIIRYKFQSVLAGKPFDTTGYEATESMLLSKYGKPDYSSQSKTMLPFEPVEMYWYQFERYPEYTITSLIGDQYNSDTDKTFRFTCPAYSQWVIQDTDGYVIVEHVRTRRDVLDGYLPKGYSSEPAEAELLSYIHLTNDQYKTFVLDRLKNAMDDL